jgi:hypothetical protein
LNLRAVDGYTEALRFAVQVVAIAGGQRQHEEFAAVHGRAMAGRFGRNGQRLRRRI